VVTNTSLIAAKKRVIDTRFFVCVITKKYVFRQKNQKKAAISSKKRYLQKTGNVEYLL